jgi:hypothetical protein
LEALPRSECADSA